MKSPLGQKLYFSISEVAEITDLQPYILRTWEKEFACLRPRRLHGKNRAYRQGDINLILLIKRLLYEERFTIQGVRQKLRNDSGLLKSCTGSGQGEDPDRGHGSEGTAVDLGESGTLSVSGPVPARPMMTSAADGLESAALGALDRQALEEIKGQLREILRLLA